MMLKGKGMIAPDMDADIVIRSGNDIRHVIAGGAFLVKEGKAKESMYEGV